LTASIPWEPRRDNAPATPPTQEKLKRKKEKEKKKESGSLYQPNGKEGELKK